MANYLGNKLNRAIRDRAYMAGLVRRKTVEIERLRSVLDAAIVELEAAQAAVAKRDEEITAMSAINLDDIRAIRGTPRSGLFARGQLSGTIVQVLKQAGQPVSTTTIIAVVSEALGLPIDSWAEREVTHRRIRKQLQVYARKGIIERLHDLSKSDPGLWRWQGC